MRRTYFSKRDLFRRVISLKENLYSAKEIGEKLLISTAYAKVLISNARAEGLLPFYKKRGVMISENTYLLLSEEAKKHDLSIESYVKKFIAGFPS